MPQCPQPAALPCSGAWFGLQHCPLHPLWMPGVGWSWSRSPGAALGSGAASSGPKGSPEGRRPHGGEHSAPCEGQHISKGAPGAPATLRGETEPRGTRSTTAWGCVCELHGSAAVPAPGLWHLQRCHKVRCPVWGSGQGRAKPQKPVPSFTCLGRAPSAEDRKSRAGSDLKQELPAGCKLKRVRSARSWQPRELAASASAARGGRCRAVEIMLGKTEPRGSVSSLVMIAADLSAKPGILIASGGEEGERRGAAPGCPKATKQHRGTCPSAAVLGLSIAASCCQNKGETGGHRGRGRG